MCRVVFAEAGATKVMIRCNRLHKNSPCNSKFPIIFPFIHHSFMKQFLLLLSMFIAASSFAQTEKKLKKLAATISVRDLQAKLNVIAGAEMEGRETATEGQRKAAAYIENYFKQLGLQPPTKDGYQMFFSVNQDSLALLSFAVNGQSFAPAQDVAISSFSFVSGEWNADSIVFAGFGITDSSTSDFKKVPVKNKWVLVAEGNVNDADKPAGVTNYSFRDASSSIVKAFQAKSYGAAGLIVMTKDFPRNKISLLSSMYIKAAGHAGIPLFFVSQKVASAILNKPLPKFSDIKTIEKGVYPASFACTTKVVTNTLQSSNVIGVLPGTDKKDEYVFITGHYDHLGKKDSVIYYGADDDGSGTTSVLELAETFAKAKEKGYAPRRTMVFMTVSGEEEGLWGSDYYVNHPLFPLNKTSVDLNIDMVGRIDPKRNNGDSMNYVYAIGEDKLSSDLLKISDSVNNKFVHLELDRKFNDPKDPNRFYYRSDHYNFASHGVPIIFYFNGTHADYHRPTDTVDKINFSLMKKRVQLVFYTAWVMANMDRMLVRDIPLK